MSDIQNPAIPQAQLDTNEAAEKASNELRDTIIVPSEDLDGLRTFISPTEPNTQFLVKAGEVIYAQGNTGILGMRPAMERVGDVWAIFANGVCSTRDPEVIEWCEAHAGSRQAFLDYHTARKANPRDDKVSFGMCRDVRAPNVEAWAELKAQQVALSYRPATLSPGLDVDRLANGDAPRMAHDPQSRGAQFAENGRQTDATDRAREAAARS